MEKEKKKIFSPVGEKEITRAIVREFAAQFEEYVESDVIIIGAGPSGLIAGRDLAAAGNKVLIVERNNYLGGGFWIGGYLMNKLTVRHPAEAVMQELGIPVEAAGEGLYVADGPHACSKLIAAACDAGVKFANMTVFDDLVMDEDGRVAGAVINWTPVSALPRQITCVDPVAIETSLVIDATGHDAQVIARLEDRGLLEAQNQAMLHLARYQLPCPRVMPTQSGDTISEVHAPTGEAHLVRLVTFLPGIPLAEQRWHSDPHPPARC